MSENVPQVEVLIDGEGKYKSVHLHGRTATSWQANLLIETVKLHSGAWPTGRTDYNGNQVYEMPSVEDVLERAKSIVDATLTEIARRGWSVPIPSSEELRKDGGARGVYGERKS